MNRITTALLIGAFLAASAAATAEAQSREEKVRNDRKRVEAEGFWIYNNLNEGIAQAKQSGKPLLVVLRCIPCEECVKLDDDLIEQDPLLKPLLQKFERVRIVGTNGLDLSVFQYDYDQSFAVFLMNADKTIYGRFGTRSHQTLWSEDVSIEGLAEAMKGALALHADYPKNKSALAAKQGHKPLFPTPEKFPSLAAKYKSTINYQGDVVRSCIHCHQIGDAQRTLYRDRKQAIPERILFQYPHPKTLGMILDPTTKATIEEVRTASIAKAAGFRAGDELLSLDGQPILSLADVQWVLHHAEDDTNLTAEVRRDGRTVEVKLPLAKGWRRLDDLNWRVSTWPLRRMVGGGMVLTKLTAAERGELNGSHEMALRVKRVGNYGPHGTAKRAGIRQGDVVIGYDGRTNFARETDLLAYAVNAHQPGDTVKVILLRENRELTVKLPIQE